MGWSMSSSSVTLCGNFTKTIISLETYDKLDEELITNMVKEGARLTVQVAGGKDMTEDKCKSLVWGFSNVGSYPQPLQSEVITGVKQLTILYDNGNTHTEKNLKKTNALQVTPVQDSKFEKFLTYKLPEPVEVEEGVYISGEYAVDMFNVAAVKVIKPKGDIDIRTFKPCAEKYMEKLHNA